MASNTVFRMGVAAGVSLRTGAIEQVTPRDAELLWLSRRMPTDQFLRDGTARWLARRMALGKLPEAQRTNTRMGWHNIDWHERLTPRLAMLRAEADWIAAQPDIAALVDPAKLHRIIDRWPERFINEPESWIPPAAGLTRGILAARFIAHASGRNDRWSTMLDGQD